MTRELEVASPRGGRLHVYDTDDRAVLPARLTVVWHHGTPNVGEPPEPLFAATDRLGIRWIGYDRPGYGGSTRRIGRDVASAAEDVAAIADALDLDRFAVMGHSGGGPHAMACAARLGARVVGVVAGASLAPYGADGLAWFTGMAPAGEAALRAALSGREAKELHEARDASEEEIGFTRADEEALAGDWSWFGGVVRRGLAAGPGGLVDDDLAYVAPWGFDPGRIAAPTLLLHGSADRVVPPAHGEWLASRIRGAELWLEPGEGHISVLRRAPSALEWLAQQALR